MAQRTLPQLASAPNMAALKRLEQMTLLAAVLAASVEPAIYIVKRVYQNLVRNTPFFV